ncbi:hypothetical protein UJ101_00050 [Flavobacteriaceae bacterium UJ101]|nr:hypothetical protein UJ101_00050 [Flavobacteriaceae bacterium UJ101]
MLCLTAQNEKDTIVEVKEKQYKLFIGGDLIAPLTSIWDKSSGYEFNANMRLYKKLHGVVEVGYQKNNYSKVNWDVDVDGTYYKIGANWSFSETRYSEDDFFYAGIRYAFTSYNQQINAYPLTIRDEAGNVTVQQSTSGLGKATVSASWIEFVVGARKELWNTNFFLDTSIRPKILVSSGKQSGVESIVIPGFGDDINNANAWINISLNYRIPLFKKKIKKEEIIEEKETN